MDLVELADHESQQTYDMAEDIRSAWDRGENELETTGRVMLVLSVELLGRFRQSKEALFHALRETYSLFCGDPYAVFAVDPDGIQGLGFAPKKALREYGLRPATEEADTYYHSSSMQWPRGSWSRAETGSEDAPQEEPDGPR